MFIYLILRAAVVKGILLEVKPDAAERQLKNHKMRKGSRLCGGSKAADRCTNQQEKVAVAAVVAVAAASQTYNHSLSVLFSNTCQTHYNGDLLADYERWGASFGEENGISHLREWDHRQIISGEMKYAEKVVYFCPSGNAKVVLCVE